MKRQTITNALSALVAYQEALDAAYNEAFQDGIDQKKIKPGTIETQETELIKLAQAQATCAAGPLWLLLKMTEEEN